MSRSANKLDQPSSWKQEVNERVAAHLSQKGKQKGAEEQGSNDRHMPKGRAAQAAARVAARYANAPSFNEQLADEARAAVRAAEAASKAAQHAHAAAQSVLDGLKAVSEEQEAAWGPQDAFHQPDSESQHPTPSSSDSSVAAKPFHLDPPESELPHGDAGQKPSPTAPVAPRPFIFEARPPWMEKAPSLDSIDASDEATQPIFANLIEFPREVIATRRVRPRRAEGPLAQDGADPQLSIFEVDPGTVTLDPPDSIGDSVAPTWMQPEWSATELSEREVIAEPPSWTSPQPAALSIVSAPLERRLLGMLVDVALSVLVFTAFVAIAAPHASGGLSPRSAGLLAAILVFLTGWGYQAAFLWTIGRTPGMWFAGIALCAFDGDAPLRPQIYKRLTTLPLSVVPLSLGFVWSHFDMEGLTWHDRFSGTYLRML